MEKNFSNNINARVREVRKVLKLNQTEFGQRIGLKNGAISWIEKSGNTVTEQNIKLICEKFHVGKSWLLTGEGDMFVETEETMLSTFADKYQLSPAEREIARYCLELAPEQRAEVLEHIKALAHIIVKNEAQPSAREGSSDESIARELADYEQELRAEQQDASASTTGAEPTRDRA